MKAIAAALLLAGCSQAPSSPPEPIGQVELVSLNCDTEDSFGVVTAIIRNSGQTSVDYATAYLRVEGKTVAAPILAGQFPPGAMGEAVHAIGEARPVSDCALVSVQDRQGRNVLKP